VPETHEAYANAVECYGLQLRASRERVDESLQTGLDRLAAGCHSVQEAFAIEVFDGGDAGGVRLGLEVAPGDELGEGLL
jgi:hypothetical protein